MKIIRIVSDLMESNSYILVKEDSGEGLLIDPVNKNLIEEKLSDVRINPVRKFEQSKRSILSDGINLKAIINTHGHIDHIWGDKDFNLPVWIHEKDKDFLKQPYKNLSLNIKTPLIINNPINTVKDNEVIELAGINIKIVHTPGHTPGSICLKINRELFTGDTLFRESFGRTDFHDSSFEKLKHSIVNKIFALHENIRILPGHGPYSTIGHEKKYNAINEFL